VDEDLPLAHKLETLEVCQIYRYRFQIHCGMEWLGEFNGMWWFTDDPIFRGSYPENLRQYFTNPDEQVSPEVWTHITLVADDEIRLTLPDGSDESVYYATDREWPGCA